LTWVALSLWPFVSAALFFTTRLPVALLATLIGGYLLLPTQTELNLPLLPALDKNSIPALLALLFVLVKVSSQKRNTHFTQPDWPVLPGILPRDRVVLTLFLLMFVGHIGTHFLNRDPLFYGPRMLPALRPYDAAAVMMATALQFVPFLLARKVLSSNEGQRLLLISLAIAGAAYAFLAMYEVRMSPQLNRMVYGFFPHEWIQHWRGNGWRPVVFVEHGLQLSIFFAMALISAATLVLIEDNKRRFVWVLTAIWLFFALYMSKSLGAFLISIVLLGVIFMTPKRIQLLFIFGVASSILLYPVIRSADILPYEQILSNVDVERAHSLTVRLDSEQLLLEKANERPIFGWGGWSRSRVFAEDGRDIAITDGAWIIFLGLGGWLKYISVFGLLTWGMLQLFWQKSRGIDTRTIGVALVLTANLVDLIPNSAFTPITLLLAGALCGRLEHRATAPQPEQVAATLPSGREGVRYARTLHSNSGDAADRVPAPYRRPFSGDRT
jgi:hypothetical protein